VVEVPGDRRYTDQHEWAKEEDGKITVGITDYAQDQLGDVVFVGLPEPGSQVEAGVPLGEVESTKSVSDIFSPVGGTVLEKNGDVEQHPEVINQDPYGRGWLVRIEPAGGDSLDGLMAADDYRKLMSEE